MRWESDDVNEIGDACVRVSMVLGEGGMFIWLVVRSTKKASERVRVQCERNVGVVIRAHSS
jgi:hypothetical protein